MDDSYCTTPTSNPFLHYNTCQQTDLLYHTPVKATARPQYHEKMMYHHEHMKTMQHALQKNATTTPVAYNQSYQQLTQFPFHQQQHHQAYPQGIMTPLSTPQPINDLRHARFYQTPRPFALKTDCSPTTPALSVNTSADSTPPSSYDYLPTPMYSAPLQWLKSQSPPATPIYEYPSAMTSMYSSPSPVDSQPPCEQESSFCDPRDVFGDSMSCYGLTTPLDGSLPVLGSSVLEAPSSKLELELDGLFNIPFTSDAGYFSGFNKRQRSDMASFSSADDECLFANQLFDESEDDTLGAPWMFVPTEPAASFCSDMSMASFHAQTVFDASPTELAASQVVAANGASTHCVQSHSHAHAHDRGSQGPTAMSLPVPAAVTVTVNRRGRKPSLTEDPSKTFVCQLCARRFRRQEHLKRHYRSLHTQDKPFKCGECNKVFSRSDNLSQHQRTHGTGSFPLDVVDSDNITDAEADEDDEDGAAANVEAEDDVEADADAPELDDTLSASPESDSDRMAKILYQAARRAAAADAAAAEASDSTLSDDQSAETGSPVTRSMRKRARSDE